MIFNIDCIDKLCSLSPLFLLTVVDVNEEETVNILTFQTVTQSHSQLFAPLGRNIPPYDTMTTKPEQCHK